MRTRDAAREIVRCCRRLWECGLIAGADGNVSVRLGPDRVLVTPRGFLKCDLSASDLVEVSLTGRHLRGREAATTELDLHLTLYRRAVDCTAVVHAHPPTATGYSVAGRELEADALPELLLLVGRRVPTIPFAVPGTPEVGRLVAPLVPKHRAVLLANHGAVTWGNSLRIAQIRMESLEHAARILAAARALGRVRRLPRAAVERLDPEGGKRDG